MPNSPVPATAEGMPNASHERKRNVFVYAFDRAAIMREAWKQYRYVRRSYAPWQIERGIVDGSFANALRIAWRLAKQDRQAEAIAAVHSERIAELRAEIDLLSYKPARIDITPMRRALEAQIAALAA